MMEKLPFVVLLFVSAPIFGQCTIEIKETPRGPLLLVENERVSLSITPEWGGKIADFWDKLIRRRILTTEETGGEWYGFTDYTLNGPDWKEKAFRYKILRKTLRERAPLDISPRNPLLIPYWHHDPPAGRISDCWKSVPQKIRKLCAFRIWTGDAELRGDFWALLEEIEGAKVRSLLQVEHANIWKLPLPAFEEIFHKYPHVIGAFVTEYGYPDFPHPLGDMNKEYLVRLIRLCGRYGRLLIFCDGHWTHHTFLSMGNERRGFDALRENRENVVLMWKQNSPKVSFLVHSAIVGLWLSGACRNWGVGSEAWYWWEAGFGKLGEATGRPGGMPPQNMPECFLSIMMLMGACSGATVYQFESGGSWETFGHPFHQGKPTEWVRDVLFPLFERLVEWELIPSQEEVIASMPVAYHACPEDVEWVGDEEGFVVNRRLRNLLDVAYKWHYFNEMIPNVAGRQIVSVIPSLASKRLLPRFKTLLLPKDAEEREQLEKAFWEAYEKEGRVEGNAFCVKVGPRIFACNPWENWDKPSWFEATLDKPFISLRAELPVHSSLVGRQKGKRLLPHLNGGEERRSRLTVRAERRVEISSQPKEAAAVEAEGVGRIVILINHALGPCDLFLKVDEEKQP